MKNDSGDICSAGNTQFEQAFLGLFLGQAISAHDCRDGIGDFCVADYLAECDEVDLILYTSSRFTGLFIWSRSPPSYFFDF